MSMSIISPLIQMEHANKTLFLLQVSKFTFFDWKSFSIFRSWNALKWTNDIVDRCCAHLLGGIILTSFRMNLHYLLFIFGFQETISIKIHISSFPRINRDHISSDMQMLCKICHFVLHMKADSCDDFCGFASGFGIKTKVTLH